MKVLPSAMWGKKATAAVVAGAFLFTTVGEPMAQTNFWADRKAARSRTATGSVVVAQNPLASIDWPKETLNPLLDNFKLPANLGSIVETHVAPSVGNATRKTLIHIQDAHGIFDAQLNAAQILEGLRLAGWAGREGPITVYQEGGTGPADTDGLSSFPFADIREEVGRAFLRQKEITGEEYRTLASSSGTFRLVGVETPDLYDRNLACRHDTVSARSTADRHISALQAGLDDIKRRVYSPSLLTLDAAIKNYEAHKIGFDEYIQAMTKAVYVREKDYPQLAAFLALLKTERELDSKALATERTILVQQLADRLSPEAVRDLTNRAAALRAGQTTHLEFYEALLSAVAAVQRPGETVPTYHLERYVRYLRQTEKIRHGLLLTESDALRDHALETLSGSDRVRQLVRLDRRLALEKLLWRQELTPDQYAALRKIDPMDWPATARFLSELGAPAVPTDFAWTSAQEQVQAYYELAQNRDQALSSNALNEMDRTGVTRAVLIAGGFHTPGLTRLWRDQGINYVVVQPRFDLQESSPAPGELKISKDMLIARAQVRERLGMGRDGVGASLGKSVSSQLSFSMLGRAALENVLGSVGEKMKAQKEAAIQKLRPWMAENKIQIHSAAQIGNTAENAMILVFGQKDGIPCVVVSQESGNKFVVLDPKQLSKDVSGTYSAALTRQLEGLVTNQTLNWQEFVGAISSWGQRGLDAATQTAKLNEAKTAFQSALAPLSAQIIDFAVKSDQPLTPQAKEGQAIIDNAINAAQTATIRAPSRMRQFFIGNLSRYFNRKTLTAGAVLSVGSASAMAAGTVAAAPGLGPILVAIGLLAATVAVVAGYRPALKAIKGAISPESTVSTTDQRKSALPLVAGLAAGGAIFLLGLPLGITFLLTALSSSVVALLSPVFLIMNVMSGISFFMVALVVGYKLYFSNDYKEAKWAGVARVAAPVVGMVFTSGVLLAAMGALALWSLATDKDVRKIKFLQPLFMKIDTSTESITKVSSSLAAFNPSHSPPWVQWLLLAPLKAVHMVKDLGNTFKSFAFQSALDLYAIYEGTSTKNENTLTSAERGYQKTLNFLRGQSSPGSLRYALAQAAGMALLTIFYTQSVVAKRMGLMVLSTIASFVGAQAVGAFVGVAVLGGGFGGIAMAAVFFYQAYRFYQRFGKERTRWIAGTNARMVVFALLGVAALATGGLAFMGTDAVTLLGNFYSFNPVQLVGVDVNGLAQLAQASPHDHWLQFKLAAFNALSPSAIMGSTLLGLLMTVKGIATQMQLSTKDPNSTLSTAARLFGWTKYALPVVVSLWKEQDVNKRKDFAKRVRSTVLGLQLVGPEVAAAVGVAAYAGGLNIGAAPVADVVNRIENTQDLSIMSLSAQLTESVSASLFGEPGRINVHDYTIIGTGYTAHELTLLSRGINPREQPVQERVREDKKNRSFKGLLPLLFDKIIPSARSEEVGRSEVGPPLPQVIDPLEKERGPRTISISNALGLTGVTAEERVSRIRAANSREFVQEQLSKYLTADLVLAGRLIKDEKSLPPSMREILKLLYQSPGGTQAYLLEGAETLPGRTSEKKVVETQVNLIMNATIYDKDAKGAEKVRVHAARMRELMVLLEEGVTTPRMIIDFFADIKEAENKISVVKKEQADLKRDQEGLQSSSGQKGKLPVENIDRALKAIKHRQDDLNREMDRLLGQRQDAIKKLKEKMPSLWPEGTTLEEALASRFDFDESKIDSYVKEKLKFVIAANKGWAESHGIKDVDASNLRVMLTKEKVAMLKAAIPAGENYRLAMEIAVTLLRAVASKASGGVGLAIGAVANFTINDPVQNSLKNAGVWAYAQAVVELEQIEQQEKVVAEISKNFRNTHRNLVEMDVESLGDVRRHLDIIRDRTAAGTLAWRDYLTARKAESESTLANEGLKREEQRWAADKAQYEKSAGGSLLRPSQSASIEALVAEVNRGRGLFGRPDEQLKISFGRLAEQDRKAMTPALLGANPSYEPLAEMMIGRSYSIRQGRYLTAQREAELEAVAKSEDPKWFGSLGFFTSGEKGKELRSNAALQAGVSVSLTYDPAKALRVKEFELQVDAADLNTAELTNRAMNELGNQLQALEHLLETRRNIEKSIQKLEEIKQLNERAERVHNIDRELRKSQDERALAQFKKSLVETNNLIDAAIKKINEKIGKSEADAFNFDNRYMFRNIQTSLPYFRFQELINRTREGDKITDRLNQKGIDLLTATGKEIEVARVYLAKMKEQALALPDRPAGAPPSVDLKLVEVLETQLNEFERVRARAERNATSAPGEVYKDLSELSERALALLLFKASLSPETKWKTAEGMQFDTSVNSWDKEFRGRFDIFASQRIALKNAEVFQARAAIAAKTEPITLNLDVFSLFFGRSGLDYSVAGGSNVWNILNISIPQKVKEDLFSALHPFADAARKNSPEGFGAFVANIIPGYQSARIREKSISVMLWQAQKEMTIAEHKAYDVQSNRESFIGQYKLALKIRGDMAKLQEMRQKRERDDTPLFETRDAELLGDLEDLQTERDLQEMNNRVRGLEISLVALGINPVDLPPFVETPERAYKAGVSFGGKVAPETFEVIQMRIARLVAQLELEQTILAQGMPRMETRLSVSVGSDRKVAPGISVNVADPKHMELRADRLARIAAVERADSIIQQTESAQATRTQDDWRQFVVADTYQRLAEDLHAVVSPRMKTLADAKMTSSEEYNNLNRLTSGILVLWQQGGAGLRDATYKLHIALGLIPTNMPNLSREEALSNLNKAAGRKLGDFSSQINISLHDPAHVVVLRELKQRLPPVDRFGDLWRPVLSRGPTDPLRVPQVPERAELKMREAELSAERTRNLLPKVDITAFLKPLDGRIAELTASWRVWGGGGKSREKIIEGEIAITQERLTEKMRSHLGTIENNKLEIARKLTRLNEINERIEELKGEARKLHKDYINDQVQLSQLATLQYNVVQLSAERADVYMTIALRYQQSRDLLKAYDIEIPLLEDALDKIGLPRIPAGQRAMFDEQKLELLSNQVVAPVSIAETKEWDQSQFRQPGTLYKPADGRMEQNPEQTVSRITNVFGQKVDVPPHHLDFKGEAWFKKEAGAMAREGGMKLADDRLLNESDWAAYLDHVLKGYRVKPTPELMSRLRMTWQRVNTEYKDLTDSSELPNAFSKYTEFSFKKLFPRHAALTADLDISLRMDKNFHKKLALAIYYATEIPLHQDIPNWFETTFARDASTLRLMDAERKNKVRLSEEQKKRVLEWEKNHNAAMDRAYFVTRFDIKEQEAFKRAAQAGVAKMFPELARWGERLGKEAAAGKDGQRSQGIVARYGDLDLESLYASLTAMAISNGWSPETLTRFLEFQASVVTPQVGRYAKGSTIQDYAQQPDADRLRFLLQGYRQRAETAGGKDRLSPEEQAIYKDLIDAEKAKEEAKFLLATSNFWALEFFKDLNQSVDQVLKDPKSRDRIRRHFSDLTDKFLAVKKMPEVASLIKGQQPGTNTIFWLSSEVQGVLTSLAMDWSAEKWTERELKAHLGHVMQASSDPNFLGRLAQYLEQMGIPVEKGLRDPNPAKRIQAWGDLSSGIKAIRDVYKKEMARGRLSWNDKEVSTIADLDLKDLGQALDFLLHIHGVAMENGIPLVPGAEKYFYEYFFNLRAPDNRFLRNNGISIKDDISLFFKDYAAVRNVRSDAARDLLDPNSSLANWLVDLDLTEQAAVRESLRDMKESIEKYPNEDEAAVYLAGEEMRLRKISPEQVKLLEQRRLFIQAINIVFSGTETPRPLDVSDLDSWVSLIERGILKSEAQIAKRFKFASHAQKVELRELSRFEEGVRGRIPLMSSAHLRGLATRADEMGQSLSESEAWVVDAATIQEQRLKKTQSEMFLPIEIVNSLIEPFRRTAGQLTEYLTWYAGERLGSTGRTDDIFTTPDIRPDDDLARRILLVYLGTDGELLSRDRVDWVMGSWKRIAVLSNANGVTEGRLAAVQSEFAQRMSVAGQVFEELVGIPLRERKGFSNDDRADLAREKKGFLEKVAPLMEGFYFSYRARHARVEELNKAEAEEKEAVREALAQVEKQRLARKQEVLPRWSDANFQREKMDNLRNLALAHRDRAHPDGLYLDQGDLKDLVRRMASRGFTEEEALERYYYLPHQLALVVFGRNFEELSLYERGLLADRAERILDRFQVGNVQDTAAIEKALGRSLSKAIDEKIQQFKEDYELAVRMVETFKEYGHPLGSFDKAISVAQNMRKGAISVEHVKEWLEVSRFLSATALNLGVATYDSQRALFMSEIFKLGIADRPDSEVAPWSNDQKEMVKKEAVGLLNARGLVGDQSSQLNDKHLKLLLERLIERRIPASTLHILIDRMEKVLTVQSELRRSASQRDPVNDPRRSVVGDFDLFLKMSPLEIFVFVDHTNSDSRTRLDLAGILGYDIQHLERRILRPATAAFSQAVRDALYDRVPMPLLQQSWSSLKKLQYERWQEAGWGNGHTVLLIGFIFGTGQFLYQLYKKFFKFKKQSEEFQKEHEPSWPQVISFVLRTLLTASVVAGLLTATNLNYFSPWVGLLLVTAYYLYTVISSHYFIATGGMGIMALVKRLAKEPAAHGADTFLDAKIMSERRVTREAKTNIVMGFFMAHDKDSSDHLKFQNMDKDYKLMIETQAIPLLYADYRANKDSGNTDNNGRVEQHLYFSMVPQVRGSGSGANPTSKEFEEVVEGMESRLTEFLTDANLAKLQREGRLPEDANFDEVRQAVRRRLYFFYRDRPVFKPFMHYLVRRWLRETDEEKDRIDRWKKNEQGQWEKETDPLKVLNVDPDFQRALNDPSVLGEMTRLAKNDPMLQTEIVVRALLDDKFRPTLKANLVQNLSEDERPYWESMLDEGWRMLDVKLNPNPKTRQNARNQLSAHMQLLGQFLPGLMDTLFDISDLRNGTLSTKPWQGNPYLNPIRAITGGDATDPDDLRNIRKKDLSESSTLQKPNRKSQIKITIAYDSGNELEYRDLYTWVAAIHDRRNKAFAFRPTMFFADQFASLHSMVGKDYPQRSLNFMQSVQMFIQRSARTPGKYATRDEPYYDEFILKQSYEAIWAYYQFLTAINAIRTKSEDEINTIIAGTMHLVRQVQMKEDPTYSMLQDSDREEAKWIPVFDVEQILVFRFVPFVRDHPLLAAGVGATIAGYLVWMGAWLISPAFAWIPALLVFIVGFVGLSFPARKFSRMLKEFQERVGMVIPKMSPSHLFESNLVLRGLIGETIFLIQLVTSAMGMIYPGLIEIAFSYPAEWIFFGTMSFLFLPMFAKPFAALFRGELMANRSGGLPRFTGPLLPRGLREWGTFFTSPRDWARRAKILYTRVTHALLLVGNTFDEKIFSQVFMSKLVTRPFFNLFMLLRKSISIYKQVVYPDQPSAAMAWPPFEINRNNVSLKTHLLKNRIPFILGLSFAMVSLFPWLGSLIPALDMGVRGIFLVGTLTGGLLAVAFHVHFIGRYQKPSKERLHDAHPWLAAIADRIVPPSHRPTRINDAQGPTGAFREFIGQIYSRIPFLPNFSEIERIPDANRRKAEKFLILRKLHIAALIGLTLGLVMMQSFLTLNAINALHLLWILPFLVMVVATAINMRNPDPAPEQIEFLKNMVLVFLPAFIGASAFALQEVFPITTILRAGTIVFAGFIMVSSWSYFNGIVWEEAVKALIKLFGPMGRIGRSLSNWLNKKLTDGGVERFVYRLSSFRGWVGVAIGVYFGLLHPEILGEFVMGLTMVVVPGADGSITAMAAQLQPIEQHRAPIGFVMFFTTLMAGNIFWGLIFYGVGIVGIISTYFLGQWWIKAPPPSPFKRHRGALRSLMQGRFALERAANRYFGLLNTGAWPEELNPPKAFLLLGNPFLQSVTDLAQYWNAWFKKVPIVLAGGIGAGTPGLLAAVKKQFKVDEPKIVNFLKQQSPELYGERNFETDPMTEADLMRFTLMKSGVPSNMIRQETVPSSNLDENFQNTQEILRGLAEGGRVGVITGAPMRLRFGAVAATMKTKLDLSYEPVVMNVGPQNLASMNDDELADLVQVRAGNNGGEVAWWANALGRELSEAEQTLKQKLEMAREDALEKLKQFNSLRVQKSIWDTSLNNVKNILKSGVEFGKNFVAFVSSISEKIVIKPWVKPVLIAGIIMAGLHAGSALAAPVAGEQVVAAGTVTATGTSAMMGRLSTAALPAVFGLGLATAMGGRKTSDVGLSSHLNWVLDPVKNLLRAGALLNVPVPRMETPKGHALFVDLRTGTSIASDGNVAVDPAVGKLFIAQLRSLEQQLSSSDTDKPVTVELVFNSNDFNSLGGPAPARVFQALLAQSNISKSLAEKISFNVIVENQVTNRLATLAPTMHLNVVAPADGAMAFWLEVGKQANVSLAILLAQLMSDTDVTFTGEAAKEMARRTGQEVDKDGTFTLKKALSPVGSIEAEQAKLVLFNKQA